MTGDHHGLGDSLEAWAAELRIDAAARSRAERAWHARLGTEEASFRGVLADLGARGRPVVLDLVGGRRHRGWVRLVGSDVVVVRTSVGSSSWADVVVALDALAVVRAAPGAHDGVGAGQAVGAGEAVGSGPTVAATTTLGTVLATLAGTGIEVGMTISDHEPLVGEIDAVGDDLVVVRPEGRAGPAYVRLGSVLEVSVPESG